MSEQGEKVHFIFIIKIVFPCISACVPAVGDSGLGVSGSSVVSVDAFLFGSCKH